MKTNESVGRDALTVEPPVAGGGQPPSQAADNFLPEASLAKLADRLEATTASLRVCLSPPPQSEAPDEAEQCLNDLREVCSNLRGVALLLDSMLAQNTAEHREMFKTLVAAFAESVRKAGSANQGMVEQVDRHIAELGDMSPQMPVEDLAARLQRMLANVRTTAGNVSNHIAAVAADVDNATQQIESLESVLVSADKKAHHDALTGVRSRLALDLALYEAIGNADGRVPWCFLLIDIDRLSAVNESLGRPVGDALLCKVVRMIEQALPGEDAKWTLGRFGGEEFGLVLQDAAIVQASKLGEMVRAKIASSKWSIRGSEAGVLQATVSIGVTEFTLGDTAKTLVDRAVGALRKAKAGGRNRVLMEYPKATGAAASQRAAMRGRL